MDALAIGNHLLLREGQPPFAEEAHPHEPD
jgi:hypothetical protein